MNMAAFAVIVARERETEPRRLDRRGRGPRPRAPAAGLADDDLDARRSPGIPATAGFIGKFYLIDAAVAGGYTWLGVVIVIGSMISLGYYLPVIAAMWMREAPAERRRGREPAAADAPGRAAAGARRRLAGARRAGHARRARASRRSLLVAIAGGAATIFFGIVPQPLFDLVHGVGSALGLL